MYPQRRGDALQEELSYLCAILSKPQYFRCMVGHMSGKTGNLNVFNEHDKQ